MRGFGARYTILVGAALALALATGCSSSGGGKGGGGGTGTAGGGSQTVASSAAKVDTPTGTPVKIMLIAVMNNPALSQPEQFAAAQARVDAINAGGGVGGHKLVLETCDSKLDPNVEQACLNQAVSDNVSAVVGSTIIFSQLTVLEKAHIPFIGAQGITPTQFQSAVSYPFNSDFAWFGGIAQMVKADGLKSVAVGYLQGSSSQFSAGVAVSNLRALGVKVTTQVGASASATDFTADAATLTRGNPGGIVLVMSGTSTPALAGDIRQSGYAGKLYTYSSGFNAGDIAKFASTLEGVRVSSAAMPVSNTTDPGVKEFTADMSKYEPSAKLDEFSEYGWSGVQFYYQIMKNAKAFTGADVIAAANKLTTGVDVGPYGTIYASGKSPLATYPRLFNHKFVPGVIKNGKIVATGGFEEALAGA